MNQLDVATKFVINKTGRVGLIVQKYAPELMLGAGLTGLVVAAVIACKASTKVEKTIEEVKEDIEYAKAADLTGEERSPSHYQKEVAMAYLRSGMRFARLYGPSVSLGAASVVCILGSHGIMKRRNVALVAAYNLMSESFNAYRKRVTAELGEDKERLIRHDGHEDTIEETVDGKVKKKKVKLYNAEGLSGYARYFDSASSYWRPDSALNLFFLRTTQNWANDLLKARGHVFLNEVYEMLGLRHSAEGALVGWIMGDGDSFIDFGIYVERNEAFVDGRERSIMLDFNVAGTIFDKIP